MKVVESGMPDEALWEAFFNPEGILKKLEVSDDVADVVDFGCGYGTFTIPAARLVSGTVYAIDIEEDLVKSLGNKVKKLGIKNVRVFCRDIESEGAGLTDGSVDYIMLFDILHGSSAAKFISEAYRILRPGGRIGIIHWNYDPTTPRGPPMEVRYRPEQCIKLGENAGFRLKKRLSLRPYHYGIIMEKFNNLSGQRG